MEALIIFLSELVLVLAVAGVIFSIISLITIVLGGLNLGINRIANLRKVKWLRYMTISFTILFFIILVLTLAVNYIFFEPTARLVLDQVKTRTGIALTFGKIDGNVFTGTVRLQDVTMKRETHETSCFDLKAKEIDMDMDMAALLSGRTIMEKLRINGLNGSFRRMSTLDHLNPPRTFEIKNLVLEDSAIIYSDYTRGAKVITIPIHVQRFTGSPFRSTLVVFDILCNSLGTGTLMGNSGFIIHKEDSRDGKESRWEFNDLQLELISSYFGSPFDLISDGSVFLTFQNQWIPGREPGINMDFNLTIRDLKAAVPDTYPESGIRRNMADRLVTYINKHSRELSFSFSFRISEKTLKFAISPDGIDFYKQFRENLYQGLMGLTGKTKEKMKDIGKKGVERFKDYLEKRRKKREI